MRDPGRPLSEGTCGNHDKYGSYSIFTQAYMNRSKYVHFHNISELTCFRRSESNAKAKTPAHTGPGPGEGHSRPQCVHIDHILH